MCRTDPSRWLCWGLLLGLACAGLAGCREAPTRPNRPNLVVLMVDNLRRDHLGFYGYARPISPQMDALAARGTVFEHATATSSWTKPSVASLFTALPPSEHEAVSFDRHISPEVPTLPEVLQQAGYHCVGVSGNFVHISERGGFGRGFDVFKSYSVPVEDDTQVMWRYHAKTGEIVPLRAPTAEEMNAAVLERLPESPSEPLFLYVHYMEPHSPFTPPRSALEAIAAPGTLELPLFATNQQIVDLAAGRDTVDARRRAWLIDLYDAEIASVDAAIGELLRELEERGFLREAVIALVSDHGEEFGEHGGFFHGITLFGESLAIPLVIVDTRSGPTQTRLEERVDLADVPTTLLDLAGVEAPPGVAGRALLRPGALPVRDLVAELHPDRHFERDVRAREHRFSLLRFPWKLIVDRDYRATLYRVDDDAGELRPRLPQQGEAPDELLAALPELLERFEASDEGWAQGAPLDPELRERLRALGYAR